MLFLCLALSREDLFSQKKKILPDTTQLSEESEDLIFFLKQLAKGSLSTALSTLTIQSLEEYLNRTMLEDKLLEKKMKDVRSKAIPEITSLFNKRPDINTHIEALMQYAYILYYTSKKKYEDDVNRYKEKYQKYLESQAFKLYSDSLRAYYANPAYQNDYEERFKPKQPPPPKISTYDVESILDIYDKTLNLTKSTKVIPHILFSKGFLLYELYKNYQKLSDTYQSKLGDTKKIQSLAVITLKELLKRFPLSPYTVETCFLIGELFFNTKFNQPSNTIQSIPYYHQASQYIIKNGIGEKYYQKILYKLAFAHFRVENYKEALLWFNILIEKIEEDKIKYNDKVLPEESLSLARDEVLTYIAECFEKIQKEEDPTKSAASLISTVYNSSIKSETRSFIPIIYQKLGEIYEQQTSYEKVREVFTELLQRFPDYERAPYIVGKVISLLNILTKNGEYRGKELEALEDQLYKEQEKIFYRYGKNSTWYKNIESKIEEQRRQGYVSYGMIDERILEISDRLGRNALLKNIINAISRAQQYEGSLVVVDRPYPIDTAKANELYNISLRDIENYLKTIYPRYDTNAFYAEYQKANILYQKKDDFNSAFEIYMKLAKNPRFDILPSDFELPDAPLISYRKKALDISYTIVDSIVRRDQSGLYNPQLDTLSILPRDTIPFTESEIKLVDILRHYLYLLPNDTISVRAGDELARLYLLKGYEKMYQLIISLLSFHYPTYLPDIQSLALLARKKYDVSSLEDAQRIASAIYEYPGDDSKDSIKNYTKVKQFAYDLLGSAIGKKAELYQNTNNFVSAAKEYERLARRVPNHKEVIKAIELAFKYYDSAGQWQDALRMARLYISKNKVTKDKIVASLLIENIFHKQNMHDSVIATLVESSKLYQEDSVSFAIDRLITAISYASQKEKYGVAIALSDTFLTRYPQDSSAYRVAFNKITLAQKGGNKKQAFYAYGDFAEAFPDSSLSVEAYYRRALYAESISDSLTKTIEYQKAVETNDRLPIDKKNNIIASESLWKLTKLKLATYLKTSILPPDVKSRNSKNKKNLVFKAEQKERLFTELVESFKKLLRHKGHRFLFSLYNLSLILKNKGDAYLATQDLITKNMEDEENTSSSIYFKDLLYTAYQHAYKNYFLASKEDFSARKILFQQQENFIKKDSANQKKLESTSLSKQNLLIDNDLYTKLKDLAAKPFTHGSELLSFLEELDSLSAQWVNKMASPLPRNILANIMRYFEEASAFRGVENAYRATEISKKTISFYEELTVSKDIKNKQVSVGKGKNKITLFLGDIAELNALSKIVSSKIRPTVSQATAVYDSVLTLLRKEGFSNHPKFIAIEKKIDSCLYIPIKRMSLLTSQASTYFNTYDQKHDNTITEIEEKGKEKSQDVIDLVVLKIKMTEVTKLLSELSNATLQEFSSAYKVLEKANISQEKKDMLATEASKFIYEQGMLFLNLQKRMVKKYETYNENANKFIDKSWLERSAITYQAIQNIIKSISQNILSQAIFVISEYNIQNTFTAKSLFLLVETDRAKYLSYLGSEAIKEMFIQGDWKFKLEIPEESEFDWYRIDFPDPNWIKESQIKDNSIELSYFFQEDTTYSLKSINVSPYWYQESSSLSENKREASPPDTSASEFIYMRKSFDFNDAIQFAQILVSNDILPEKTEIYLNDYFISILDERIVTTDDLPYHYNNEKQIIIDVTDKIIRGKNTIALKVPRAISSVGVKLAIALAYYGAISDNQIKKLERIFTKERRKQKRKIKKIIENTAESN